ncbi:hypothetical protein EC957_002453 [Mortierella hygrophila]|uniref:C2H2-type domain-containing protein n=1 Tax=Mortierella hygrophila TaxID=979708 RepID=A0A9P6K7H4_9FUNG|nr:hypothetical protein EC957_002453 [Mortierella hygrophila]
MAFDFGLDALHRGRTQFNFSFPRQPIPDRQDDLMMDSLFDFTQTSVAALSAASLEHLLNSPVPFIDMTSEATQNLILNTHNSNTATPVPAVVFNNPHAFLHHHRHKDLYSSFDELVESNNNLLNNCTNRNNNDNKKFDTRQEYYYPGLELSSPYEQLENPDDDLLNFDCGFLDFGVENDPFDVEEYQKLSMFVAAPPSPKPEYTAIPSEAPLFPVSVQDEPVERASVGMNVDESSDDENDDDDDECDSDSDCDNDGDSEVVVAATIVPMISTTPIQLLPTPSLSPSPSSSSSTSPPPPPSPASQSSKLPRSRAKKGEKRVHACPECRREFTRACNLQSHILTHSNLKPHACSQCEKTFARVYDMQRHKRIHSDELKDKPYACLHSGCSLRFKRTEPRNRHCQFVHGWVGK